MTKTKLALFNVDGTITTDDSLIKFIHFLIGNVKTKDVEMVIIIIKMILEWKFKGMSI